MLSGLNYRPGEPQFPHPCLLHSICAAASVYNPSAAADEGLEHAELAKSFRDNILCQQNPGGNDMFTCLQCELLSPIPATEFDRNSLAAFIIISTFYYSIGVRIFPYPMLTLLNIHLSTFMNPIV